MKTETFTISNVFLQKLIIVNKKLQKWPVKRKWLVSDCWGLISKHLEGNTSEKPLPCAPPHIKFSWPKMKYVHKIALKKMWSPKNQNSNIEIF